MKLKEIFNNRFGGNASGWSVVKLNDNGVPAIVDQSYLTIRLISPKLSPDNTALSQFAPLIAFGLELSQPTGNDTKIPIVLNPIGDLSETIDSDDGAEQLVIKDVVLLESLPITFANFSILGGLFARRVDAFGDVLIDVLSDLSSKNLITAMSSVIQPLEIAYTGLRRMWDGEDTQMRVGTYMGFRIAETENDVEAKTTLHGGKIAFLSLPGFQASDLLMKNGALGLQEGASAERKTQFSKANTLVIEFEIDSRRRIYSDLPHHPIWKKMRLAALRGSASHELEQMRLNLFEAILTTPHLVETERELLMLDYQARIASLSAPSVSDASKPSTRGSRGTRSLPPSVFLKSVSRKVEKTGLRSRNEKIVAQDFSRLAEFMSGPDSNYFSTSSLGIDAEDAPTAASLDKLAAAVKPSGSAKDLMEVFRSMPGFNE